MLQSDYDLDYQNTVQFTTPYMEDVEIIQVQPSVAMHEPVSISRNFQLLTTKTYIH